MDYVLQHSSLGLKRLGIQHEVYQKTSTKLLLQAGLKPNMRVLEIGTGGAEMSAWLASYLNLGEIVSIDVSEDYVLRANELIKQDNFSAIVADVYSLDQAMGQ